MTILNVHLSLIHFLTTIKLITGSLWGCFLNLARNLLFLKPVVRQADFKFEDNLRTMNSGAPENHERRCLMGDKQRQRRLRLLIRRLNYERKKQAQKIDILCNDFISAQAEFIKKLNTINFTASFYEAILATTDLSSLLFTAGKIIKNRLADSNVTFFVLANGSFELYMFDNDKPITLEKQHFENCFTPELVDNICKANKLCTLDDMFAMGLQDNLFKLSKISAVTIPLCRLGSSLGFILIYRLSPNKLIPDDLKNITAITCGLSRAIQSFQVTLQSAD